MSFPISRVPFATPTSTASAGKRAALLRRRCPKRSKQPFPLPTTRRRGTTRKRSSRVVAQLPDTFREVVVAVDISGASYTEAAAQLNIPVGTVMSRLYRGRRRVIEAMDD